MDKYDQLMSEPRLCRSCGRQCQGLRCRSCYRLEGRLVKLVRQSGGGIDEEKLSKLLHLENIMRRMEVNGEVHEVDGKWALGKHPKSVELLKAYEEKFLPHKASA